MASTGASSAAVSALLQKASQQYLECRRKVSAKVDEVKALDGEIQGLFQQITALGADATKSVGRLELTIAAIEGEAPVDGAVINVDIDPEYEEPAPKQVEKEEATTAVEVAEKPEGEAEAVEEEKEQETTEAAKEDSEEGETEDAPAVTATKTARSVQWGDAASVPVTFVFDPVQSREAVVTITVTSTEGDDAEPVKEIEIPVASLFQTGALDRWYEVKEEVEVVEETTITEITEEAPVKEEDVEDKGETQEKEEDVEKEKEEEEKEEEEKEEDEKEEEAKEEEAKEEEEKEDEPVADKAEEEEEAAEEEETAGAEEAVTAVVVETVEEVVVSVSRFQVKATFALSEIEKLSQSAVSLSKSKHEAEAALATLEREAASLRTKYERLSASQRSINASSGGVAKPRPTLLGGRGLGAGQAVRVEKSRLQALKDSVASVLTPQRQQVLTSTAIFIGSVALFHYQGHNLLA